MDNITITEIKELKALQTELMGDNMFVVPDFSNPKWVRLNDLSGRLQQLRKALRNKVPFNQTLQIKEV